MRWWFETLAIMAVVYALIHLWVFHGYEGIDIAVTR